MNTQNIEFVVKRARPSGISCFRSNTRQDFQAEVKAGHPVIISAMLEGKTALSISLDCNKRSVGLNAEHPTLKSRKKRFMDRYLPLFVLSKKQGREALFEYLRHFLPQALDCGNGMQQTQFTLITDAEQILLPDDPMV